MIYSRSDIGDRVGSHTPVTVLSIDTEEYDDTNRQLAALDETDGDSPEAEDDCVLCWSPEVNWIYERYGVIGGDIFFHRGPMEEDSRQEPPLT